MQVRGDTEAAGRPMTYCLVPRALAAKLHEPLRRHFRDDPSVEVIVERRGRERRAGDDRRSPDPTGAPDAERRTIHNMGGRRVGERRASVAPVAAPELPRRARPHADRLVFVERVEPAGECAEDLDSGRLVTRFQAGDREAFSALYLRYFDRVYTYLRIALRDVHEAEDATQQVFMNALEALPAYERHGQPFGAWLFTIVRNYAIWQLRRQSRLEPMDPAEIASRHEQATSEEAELATLGWISDRELLLFIERLPLVQRQVLVLRYMLGLRANEIARVLSVTPNHVSVLQYRAFGFLRTRLTALGRDPGSRSSDRAGLARYPKQARVLRRRRYALSP